VTIRGKKVVLRALEHEDLSKLRDWRNSPDIRLRTREYRLLNMPNQEEWFQSLLEKPPENIMFGIMEIEKEELIGVCGLAHIDWVNRSAEISIYIGERKYRDKGLGSESIDLLLNYAFDTLNLHRIWAEVYVLPKGYGVPGRLFLDCKFKLDGTLRHTVFRLGKYHDSEFYSILKDEWERTVDQKSHIQSQKANRSKPL